MRYFIGLFLCIAQLGAMTVEEKVGQLLMVHFIGHEVNEEARQLIQEAHVGGFIYFIASNGLTSPEQVSRLSSDLQSLAKIPLFIAIDQEGGRVTRLMHGFTLFPSNWDVGQTKDPDAAAIIAALSSHELKAVGINMNLAPVVDVHTNPQNPVIGNRSFSDDPKVVALFGKAALRGYHKGGIVPVLKHFPGHGDTSVDSHYDLPVCNRSLEGLEEIELYPFMQLAKEAPAIMTAHMIVPALDPEHAATFSPTILQGLLREKMGFKGVIISDSLLMKGALMQANSLENAAIEAFNAGCDLLIIAGGFSKDSLPYAPAMMSVHKALVEAVNEGRISQERLDASVERILNLKSGLQQNVDENIHNAPGTGTESH